jgi:hypothetical protein
MTSTEEYRHVAVYVRSHIDEPFAHTVCKDKDEALNIIRQLKAKHGDPVIGLIENPKADVLTFRFPGTAIVGRVVFTRVDLEEHVHCPSCGLAMRRNGDNRSQCHGWYCGWVCDHDNQVWRVHTISKEDE